MPPRRRCDLKKRWAQAGAVPRVRRRFRSSGRNTRVTCFYPPPGQRVKSHFHFVGHTDQLRPDVPVRSIGQHGRTGRP